MDLLLFLVIPLVLSISILSAAHAILVKRDPRSALGWVVASLMIPVIGPFFYWIFGINRISNRARRWTRKGKRLSGWEAFKRREVPAIEAGLPRGCGHLSGLRRLSDRVVSYPLLSGNHISPLVNGEGAYPAMLEAINSAEQSIHLSTYIFDSDTTGRRFIDALISASERGVKVRVLIDGIGEKYSYPRSRRLFEGSGVRVERFLPMRKGGAINLRNHRKILITDCCTAFTGGMNIGDRHMIDRTGGPEPVADLHFMVKGPVVMELQQAFLEDWYFVTGEMLDDQELFPTPTIAGKAAVKAICDGPDREYRKLHTIIVAALASARERVIIMTPYFIPDIALMSALATAALRGVEVSIILPAKNNLPLVHWASRAYLRELLEYGIRIRYQPPPFVHSKLMVVDGAWSLIGSANLDPRSLRLNFELNLEIYHMETANSIQEYVDSMTRKSEELTIKKVDRWGLPERIRNGTARLLAPYL